MPEYYYPDIAFLVNFFLDYILLYITSRMKRLKVKRRKLCLSAAAGSLIAVLADAYGAGRAFQIAGFLLGGVIMCVAAFGKRGIKGKLLALFFCTFVMGGMLYASGAFLVGNHIPLADGLAVANPSAKSMVHMGGTKQWLVPTAFLFSIFTILAGFLLLVIRMRRENAARPVYSVRFCIGENSYHCSGFLDTGNGLYDPFRKKPVLLLVAPEFKLPLEEFCKKQPEKVRYIPYRAVGTQEGMLCGAELAAVTIETEQEEICLEAVPAVYAGLLERGHTYQVILHPDFFK